MSGFGKRVHIAVRHWQASSESALAGTRKERRRRVDVVVAAGKVAEVPSGDAVRVKRGVWAHRADAALHLEFGDRGAQRSIGRVRAVGRARAGRSTSALATTGRPSAAAASARALVTGERGSGDGNRGRWLRLDAPVQTRRFVSLPRPL